MEYAKYSRRSLLAFGTAAAAGALAGAGHSATAEPVPLTASRAWQRLLDGNRRFAAGRQRWPHQDPAYRESLVEGQHPFACVLGCADSRVPPELLFDQGLGDLFTVRAVGEVLDDAVVGSIEYAVEHLHVPTLVVLGHSRCGAVTAAIDLVRGQSNVSGAVSTVARAIEATVRATPPDSDPDRFHAACVRNQALRIAEELPRRSTAIAGALGHGLEIISAGYDLASGRVRRY
jgi:carbonic anhydrase